ncbi:hypothetical protein ABPG77_000689 [Micractinium sp. CCAP 211/92]
MVHTTISVGATSVQCDQWSADTGTWATPRGATKYDASGSTVPPTSQVTSLENTICSDPKTAAKAFLQALSAGGAQAQSAVYALVNADCSASSGGGSSSGGSPTGASSSGGSSGGGSSGGGSTGGGSSGGGSSSSSDPVDQTYKVRAAAVTLSVQTFVQQICSNPQAAGQQFRTAVQAGGSQAQVAVLALFQFFTQLVAAANAVGVPMCLSIVAVDNGGRLVYGQWQFHTGAAV